MYFTLQIYEQHLFHNQIYSSQHWMCQRATRSNKMESTFRFPIWTLISPPFHAPPLPHHMKDPLVSMENKWGWPLLKAHEIRPLQSVSRLQLWNDSPRCPFLFPKRRIDRLFLSVHFYCLIPIIPFCVFPLHLFCSSFTQLLFPSVLIALSAIKCFKMFFPISDVFEVTDAHLTEILVFILPLALNMLHWNYVKMNISFFIKQWPDKIIK